MPPFSRGLMEFTPLALFLTSILTAIFHVIVGTEYFQKSIYGTYWPKVKNVHKTASFMAQKVWFNYLEMSLQLQHKRLTDSSETKKIQPINIQIFKLLTRTVRVLHHSKLVLTHPRLKPDDSFFLKPTKYVEREFITEVSVVTPIGKVQKADGSHRRGKATKTGFDHYYISHYWSFKLLDHLRLNISIEIMKFIYLFHFHECVIGRIVISSEGKLERAKDKFDYCGIKSNVVNYPRYPNAHIAVTARSNVLYSVLIFFSVIDSLQIYSYFPNLESLKFQASWGSYLYKFSQYLQTYYITVAKYNTLELQAQMINNDFDVYDGPRTRSKLLTPKYYNLEKDYSFHYFKYRTSSFQCVIQEWTGLGPDQPSTISFKEMTSFFDSIIVTKMNMKFSFPGNFCSKLPVCSLILNASFGEHINATINKFKFPATEDNTLCNYAGITGYNIIAGSSKQLISTNCLEYDGLYTYRPFYSTSNVLLILVHSYEEYGHLSLEFDISLTFCSPMIKNTCLVQHIDPVHIEIQKAADKFAGRPPEKTSLDILNDDDKCTILQLTYNKKGNKFGRKDLNTNTCPAEDQYFRHSVVTQMGRIIKYHIYGAFASVFGSFGSQIRHFFASIVDHRE